MGSKKAKTKDQHKPTQSQKPSEKSAPIAKVSPAPTTNKPPPSNATSDQIQTELDQILAELLDAAKAHPSVTDSLKASHQTHTERIQKLWTGHHATTVANFDRLYPEFTVPLRAMTPTSQQEEIFVGGYQPKKAAGHAVIVHYITQLQQSMFLSPNYFLIKDAFAYTLGRLTHLSLSNDDATALSFKQYLDVQDSPHLAAFYIGSGCAWHNPYVLPIAAKKAVFDVSRVANNMNNTIHSSVLKVLATQRPFMFRSPCVFIPSGKPSNKQLTSTPATIRDNCALFIQNAHSIQPHKTLLMMAMVLGAPKHVIKLLLKFRVPVNTVDENGWTAIRWGLHRVLVGRQQCLIDFGCQVDLGAPLTSTSPTNPYIFEYLSHDAPLRVTSPFHNTLSPFTESKWGFHRKRRSITAAQLVQDINPLAIPDALLKSSTKSNDVTKWTYAPDQFGCTDPQCNEDFDLFLDQVLSIMEFLRAKFQKDKTHLTPNAFLTECGFTSVSSIIQGQDASTQKQTDTAYRMDVALQCVDTAGHLLPMKAAKDFFSRCGFHSGVNQAYWAQAQQTHNLWGVSLSGAYKLLKSIVDSCSKSALVSQQLIQRQSDIIQLEQKLIEQITITQQQTSNIVPPEKVLKAQQKLESIRDEIRQLDQECLDISNQCSSSSLEAAAKQLYDQEMTKTPASASNKRGAKTLSGLLYDVPREQPAIYAAVKQIMSYPKLSIPFSEITKDNQDKYVLFSILYNEMAMTPQSRRVEPSNDAEFALSQEHQLANYYYGAKNSYVSESDFWCCMVNDRTTRLLQGFIRLAQLEHEIIHHFSALRLLRAYLYTASTSPQLVIDNAAFENSQHKLPRKHLLSRVSSLVLSFSKPKRFLSGQVCVLSAGGLQDDLAVQALLFGRNSNIKQIKFTQPEPQLIQVQQIPDHVSDNDDENDDAEDHKCSVCFGQATCLSQCCQRLVVCSHCVGYLDNCPNCNYSPFLVQK